MATEHATPRGLVRGNERSDRIGTVQIRGPEYGDPAAPGYQVARVDGSCPIRPFVPCCVASELPFYRECFPRIHGLWGGVLIGTSTSFVGRFGKDQTEQV